MDSGSYEYGDLCGTGVLQGGSVPKIQRDRGVRVGHIEQSLS
jgi:hypothetical protein